MIQGSDCGALRMQRARLMEENERLREALEHARQFIRNGTDLGYIRMPDGDTPDPAHDTLPKIDAALRAARPLLKS